MSGRPLTVSVTTRNRPAAVERCVRSLESIRDLVDRAIVLDDASTPPLDVERLTRTAEAAGIPLEVLRADAHTGTTAGKNMIARRAPSPYLLSLDDDAFLVGDWPVRTALEVLQRDPGVAAVAFPQSDEHGRLWPAGQQPAAADGPCYVPAFIGFACLRGLHVVYLPGAPVAHLADASNRDPRAYVRHVMRNDCLAALYNEPFVRAVCIIPYKLWSFTRMRAGLAGGDPGGLRWLLRELVRLAPAILRQRHPVRWRTLREWRRLRTFSPPYPGSGL